MPNLKSILSDPSYQGGLNHGLSVVIGAVAGLMIWISAQPLPVIPDYKEIIYLAGHTPKAALPPAPATNVPVAIHTDKPHDTPVEPHADKHSAPVERHAPKTEPETAQEHAKPPIAPTPTARAERTIPDPALVVNTPPYGPIPTVTKDGRRPFDAYRHTVSPDVLKKPLIAVAVLDFGLSVKQSESALAALPTDVSFVLSPTPDNAADWARMATKHGHEIWAELLVEPDGYPANDPGPHALMTASSIEQNHDALMAQLGRSVGYVGFIAPRFGPYFKSSADFGAITNNILSRGLGMMINGDDTPGRLSDDVRKSNPPYFWGAMFSVTTPNQAADILTRAEQAAADHGFAVVTFTPLPGTTKAVQNWLAQVQQKGFALAPLSVIAERGIDLMGAK
jgi:polysaccharide deacetylase 2 family uncharacterized protein YibQ